MAGHLTDIWWKIDKKVQSLTCDEHEINQIFGWVEDSNEVLMYISDILAIDELNPKIRDLLENSLMNFAYLPNLVNSLVILKSKKPKMCLNTCIYILI